jgi:hypothetical protein
MEPYRHARYFGMRMLPQVLVIYRIIYFKVEFTSQQLAIKFRREGARLSQEETPGMAILCFNASLSLATQ